MAESRRKSRPLRFEDRLKKLTDIVEELEQGDLSLEKAIEQFEAGKGLHAELMAELAAYEARLERLIEGPEGEERREDAPATGRKGSGEA